MKREMPEYIPNKLRKVDPANRGGVYWRIYYADGDTFSNVDGSPQNAPKKGVTCIVALDAGYSTVVRYHGTDFYWYRQYPDGTGDWFHGGEGGTDSFPIIWHLIWHVDEVIAFLPGETVKTDQHRGVMRRAERDIDFLG
jgi:hypothetical protein